MSSVQTAGLTTDMAGLEQSVGRRLGPAEWVEMTQALVNEFADLTGDHNFIHVDPERAKLTPFGGTIAHGYLSLALLAPVTQLLEVRDASTSINYGLNKLRFPGPLQGRQPLPWFCGDCVGVRGAWRLGGDHDGDSGGRGRRTASRGR